MEDLCQKVNEAYIELWEDYQNSRNLKRIPVLYPGINKNSVVFVGLNPSFNEDWREKETQGSQVEIYRWENRMQEKIDEIIKAEREAREKYVYFKHFRDWYGSWEEGGWDHIDLFGIRVTNQADLKDRLGVTDSEDIESNFGGKQFEISTKLLRGVNPKIIVVVNALASKILKKQSNGNYRISESIDGEKGCYYFQYDDISVPILFSGMVTGQRSLDTGSRERLKWQMDKIIERI